VGLVVEPGKVDELVQPLHGEEVDLGGETQVGHLEPGQLGGSLLESLADDGVRERDVRPRAVANSGG
jgi:hypothetical protein